ncbi:hexokinase-like [Littorina saxatilis]|uniref:hexokinase-like n=1 Tax=Littorina saxatilis TaxID=31220 RepID=UPI0038B51DF2
MVSWTYIGDIVRLALKRLRQEDLLLHLEDQKDQSCKLFQQDSITSDRVAMIASDTESDTESPYQKTKDILTELEVKQYTEEDMTTIRYVCRLVCDRAIYLTSAALATLINRLNQPGVMVVVGGQLNKKLPHFGEIVYSTTNKLVKPELKDKVSN